jgi:hypothetical protein
VAVANLLTEMAEHSRRILQGAERLQLNSRTGKTYFSYTIAEQSRPINEALFVVDESEFTRLLVAFRNGFAGNTPDEIILGTYSIAFSILAAHDVHKVGRKASATVFEILIGHIVSRCIGVAPRTKVRIPETGADLPTDYVFDPGPRSRKIHLPIKTSTRERAVQAWVHQLVLERIFGAQIYRGILVVGSETQLVKRTGEVKEICVPGQWQLFQARLTELTRVYYLDPPKAYLDLAKSFPRVEVKPFGAALAELRELLNVH